MTSLKACDWSGNIFGTSASPRFFTNKTGYVTLCHGFTAVSTIPNMTFELLLHAAFLADEI